MNKLLAKIGLGESEQKLLKKVTVITTLICAAVVGIFWAYTYFLQNSKSEADSKEKLLSVISNKHLTDKSENVHDINSFDLEAHDLAASRFISSGQPHRALPHLQRIHGIRRNDRTVTERIIQLYLEIEDFEKALASIDYLFLHTNDTMAENLQMRRAIALYHLKRQDESAAIIKSVLKNNPQNAEALCFMGQIETPSQTAEKYFLDAIKAAPNYSEAKYQLARFYEDKENLKKARKLLLEVIESEPLNVRAHARLGIVLFYDNEPELALRSYQTALALNPADYNTRYNLGELYRTVLNDNTKALEQYVLALKEKPLHTEANFRAGIICIENDMVKEAIRYFEAAVETDRKNIRKLIQLAAGYERLDNRKAALSIYQEITDIDPLHIIAINKIKLLSMEFE
ncbi:MAG: tetratricopeptide repeat protein [Chitinispirillales bacterium]|jgi:tetratricopeptide (TPR) repeat protein|nr:tetratricopeptide repeat protein [Chitinispirillales bacterium]